MYICLFIYTHIWSVYFYVHYTHTCKCAWEVINVYKKVESEIPQLCPTVCDPMDCSLPGSSVHGIFRAKVLEWVAISFSRGYS